MTSDQRCAPHFFSPVTDPTQAHLDTLQEYLDSLEKGARQRGLGYFEKARVQGLERYKRGIGFRAEVTGTNLYRVKLRFVEDAWEGECSCPVAFDCKHCCAVALQALAESVEPPAVAEDEPPGPAAPRATPQRRPDANVTVLFADRLGRKLNAEEKRAAAERAVEWVWGGGSGRAGS